MFGTTVTESSRAGRRVLYATRIKGSRAALLMRDLEPAMGARRRRAIAGSLSGYRPAARKLDYRAAEEMRRLRAEGARVTDLSRSFGVARSTVRQVVSRSIYTRPRELPWRAPIEPCCLDPCDGMSLVELHWLAGWLEGEGSFGRPPPSDPRRVRVIAKTRDYDVARKAGRLLGVSPQFAHDARERRLGWSPTWRVLKRGDGAARLMRALYPVMGCRRQAQIDTALAAVDLSVDGGGGSCTRVRGTRPGASTSVPVESDLGSG